MSLPVLAKTWQFQVNQTVAAQGTVLATMRRLHRTIKNLFKSFGTLPWTCSGSSNSITSGMDAVDRWTLDTDLVWAASGVAHSWIVLRQTGIATNFELCIDLNSSTTGNGSIAVSPSAGFTGGSTTTRPTATDEIVILAAVALGPTLDAQYQIHSFQSTDGQCTRFSVWRAGTNNGIFALFDVPQNPVTGWTNPSISFWIPSAAVIAASYTNLGSIGTPLGRGRAVSNMTLVLTGEGDAVLTAFLASNATLGGVPNSLSGEWPQYPIGMASTTALNIGRHGNLFDLWWRPLSVSDADTFPNNALTRQFAALGNLIFPWVGDATIPLLT